LKPASDTAVWWHYRNNAR